jgi:hypothetical protein
VGEARKHTPIRSAITFTSARHHWRTGSPWGRFINRFGDSRSFQEKQKRVVTAAPRRVIDSLRLHHQVLKIISVGISGTREHRGSLHRHW